jgi:dTDP-4-amino-4,6-dideoxygalactose transaminase
VTLIEDAAEALGATYHDTHPGTRGRMGIFSFNGNKIITTSGGGMLVSNDAQAIARPRYLASQARQPALHYEHTEVGYNYRMSNLLAAVGRGQLAALPEKLARRRAVNARYRVALHDRAGLTVMPEASYGRGNCWLTAVLVDADEFGADRETIRQHLETRNIETRPVWKPLHLQPAFRTCRVRGGDVATRLFTSGLCLPSGSSLSPGEQDRVIEGFLETPAYAEAAPMLSRVAVGV